MPAFAIDSIGDVSFSNSVRAPLHKSVECGVDRSCQNFVFVFEIQIHRAIGYIGAVSNIRERETKKPFSAKTATAASRMR